MAGFPFLIPRKVSVGASSTNTVIFNISSGETMFVKRIMVDTNSASLFVVNIRDQRGRAYILADASNPLPFTQIANAAQVNNNGALDLFEELVIEPNGTLYIDIQNTSGGALTPTVIAIGRKELGATAGA